MSTTKPKAVSLSELNSADNDEALAFARARLNATRLRLFEADQRLSAMLTSNSWQVTTPLRWLEQRPRLGKTMFRAAKFVAWGISGQLFPRLRAWRRRLRRRFVQPLVPTGTVSPPPPARPKIGGKAILIIDSAVPRSDHSAGDWSILGFLEGLLAEGWSVTFWSDDRADGGPHAVSLESLGVTVIDRRFSGGIEDYIDQYGSQLDHVMLMRPNIAAAVLPIVLRGSHALISYYGHDLHFARLRLEAAHKKDPDLAFEAERVRALERAIWRVADFVLYPCEEEAAVVRQMEPGVEGRAVIPYAFDSFVRRGAPTPGGQILFVGGFGHPPNEDAVLWLAKEILPRVLVAQPGAKLVIAGSRPTPAVLALAGPTIEVAGHVSDKRLAILYDDARVAIVPLRFGAGVKGKVVEAMHAGVPVVMTRIGAQGLPNLPDCMPVHDDPAELADAVIALLEDDEAWLRQSIEQVEYAKRRFTRSAMRASLLAALSPG